MSLWTTTLDAAVVKAPLFLPHNRNHVSRIHWKNGSPKGKREVVRHLHNLSEALLLHGLILQNKPASGQTLFISMMILLLLSRISHEEDHQPACTADVWHGQNQSTADHQTVGRPLPPPCILHGGPCDVCALTVAPTTCCPPSLLRSSPPHAVCATAHSSWQPPDSWSLCTTWRSSHPRTASLVGDLGACSQGQEDPVCVLVHLWCRRSWQPIWGVGCLPSLWETVQVPGVEPHMLPGYVK